MTDKKVLLCALNSKFIHSCLAVHSLKKFAVSKGYNKEKIKIREFTINDNIDFIIDGIFSEKPELVAFSVYIWNVEYVSRICKILRKISPDLKIVLGGPEVSFINEHPFFDKNDFDFILKGEGEKSFYELISSGKITDEKILNLDEIPFPYDEENIHLFENRIVYYESSRGCPFSCAYCLSSAEKGVRFLSLERVKSDLEFFSSHNVKQVKFVDRTFNADKKRAYEIWKFIIEKFSNSNINFHFEIAADLLDENLISLLGTAPDGLIQLEIGIQSTKDETLILSCRKTDTEKVLSNTKKLIEQGNINIHTDLIAGLPGETLEDFKKSFNDVYALKSHQLQLGFLKILHGTKMVEISKEFNFVFSPYSPYEILSNKDFSHDDILFLKKFEDVFEKIYNSQRFILSINELEKYFENPFEMFEKISEYFKEKNLSFVSVSTKEIYNLLHGFFKEKINSETENFDKLLLSDFYFSEKSELVPMSLRYLTPDTKTAVEKSSAILRSLELQKQRGLIVRFIGDQTFIVDYSKRSKITSRFSYEIYSS
ncbi:MAG: B12-binding domain-containing radical SAM protein [Clostridia bacterium]|nr:B12-binding domain-containing radical SAM protein [Clostridia bacterium]